MSLIQLLEYLDGQGIIITDVEIMKDALNQMGF